MPTAIASIDPLKCELGLRGPLGRKKDRYDSNVAVQDLYVTHIPKLCDTHASKSFSVIPTCSEIKFSAQDLLRRYGPKIWGNEAHRPWLLNSGDRWHGAEYVKDLYYDDEEDRKFLEEKIHALIVAKIQRQRKHGRSSLPARDNSSDPSWTPGPPIGRPMIPVHKPANLCCFGTNANDHFSASNLEKLGIWLGDYDNDDKAVNGRSLNEVAKDYYDSTIVGGYTGGVEPHGLFDELPKETKFQAECAACKSVSKGEGGRLKVQVESFRYVDSDGESRMVKNFWALECWRKKETLYAIIKELPEKDWRRLGSKTPLWCFWKVDGGYTNSTFLLTPVPRDEIIPILILESDLDEQRQDKGKRKRSLPWQMAEDPATTMPLRKRARESVGSAFQPINGTYPADVGADAYASREQIQQPPNTRPNLPNSATERETSHDSLYDTTPRPEARGPVEAGDRGANGARHTRFFQRFTGPFRTDGDEMNTAVEEIFSAPPEDTTTTVIPQPAAKPEPIPNQTPEAPAPAPAPIKANGIMEPPNSSIRFRVWFEVDWARGRNVVILDDSMKVQDVFARVQQSLRRKLEGKSLQALSIRFQGPSANEEVPLDIEIDDSDGWETVNELVKEEGKTELFGAVEAK